MEKYVEKKEKFAKEIEKGIEKDVEKGCWKIEKIVEKIEKVVKKIKIYAEKRCWENSYVKKIEKEDKNIKTRKSIKFREKTKRK